MFVFSHTFQASQNTTYEEDLIMDVQKNGVGFGVAGMVCGIVALLLSCCFPVVTFILALLAVIFGGLGIKKNSGKGMAIAGLVCGIIGLVPAAIITFTGAALAEGILSMVGM